MLCLCDDSMTLSGLKTNGLEMIGGKRKDIVKAVSQELTHFYKEEKKTELK